MLPINLKLLSNGRITWVGVYVLGWSQYFYLFGCILNPKDFFITRKFVPSYGRPSSRLCNAQYSSYLHCLRVRSLGIILICEFLYMFVKLCVTFYEFVVNINVNESRNRPTVAQSFPGVLGSQIFMIFGTWRWWGRQPHAPAAFTPRNVTGTHFY